MASIQRDIDIDVPTATAWDALRDVGHIHQRLVPGFVVDCRMEGRVRVVTFGTGMVVREPIIDIDETHRRVAWAATGGPFEHYNASVQAFELDSGGTRLRWIADLLPDEGAEQVAGMVEQGLATMKRTLEGASRG